MLSIDALTADNDTLKRELPIAFVMEAYGHTPVDSSDDRLHYRNPWRQDTNPSLDVFVDRHGVQRAGDYAEGFNGSVLDVIGRFEQTEHFGTMLAKARELYADYLDSGWDGPVVSGDASSREVDAEEMTRVASLRVANESNCGELLVDMLRSKPGVTLKTLRAFKVKADDNRLAIPYPDGRALRYRWYDGSKTFAKGSTPGLYHHPDLELEYSDTPLLLVEGESDTWAAYGALSDLDVVGVPGVGHQPSKYLHLLKDRPVAIAFDGDQPGRDGANRWAAALTDAGCSVSIVPIPDGFDVASLTTSAFRRLYELRRTWARNNTDLRSTPAGYEIVTAKGEDRPVSNWVARPLRLLAYDDDRPRTYEVEVTVSGQALAGRTFMLTAEDMRSSARLHGWCSQFSGSWWGGQTDHQKLRAVLEEQATFLPLDQATSRPGLAGTEFVWPGGSTGGSTTCLYDPQSPLTAPGVFRLKGGRASSNTILKLLSMHELAVTQPVLAWLAIAPLRSLYEQFPPLFITGSSGSGKTTLLEEFTEVFCGMRFITNLTSTTPYAVTLTMGSTNAFPVWFDEYRPGAKRSTMEIVDQLLRDAYNRAPSRRGGMGSDLSQVTTINTDNPMIVSGEDFADELSHRDRLVKVFVPVGGKQALPLWEEEDRAFALAYLAWLTAHNPERGGSWVERPPEIHHENYLGLSITNRQAYNLAVLDAGWGLIKEFVFDYDGYEVELPEPNWAHLLGQAQEEAASDPVLEQLHALWERGNTNAIWLDDESDTVYISSTQTLAELKRLGAGLPFTTPRALTRYLLDKLGGTPVSRTSLYSATRTRYVALASPWPDEIGSDT